MNTPLKTLLPGLAIVACALPAFASPTVTFKTDEGNDPSAELDYELHYVQISGLSREVQESVNRQLLELVNDPKRVMSEQLKADPMDPDAPGMSSIMVGTGVGVATDDMLSVSISSSTYFKGAAHPNTVLSAVSFDLRTGEEIDPNTFFPAGKNQLIAPIHNRLVRDYSYESDSGMVAPFGVGEDEVLFEGRPTAMDIQHVVVEPEGMTFMWGSGGLGAGYAMGPILATLTWAELGDSIDRDGILSSAIGNAPRPTIDIALGDNGGEEDPDAAVVMDNRGEYYLMGLEDQSGVTLGSMTVENRIALLSDDSWRNAENGDGFLLGLDNLEHHALAHKFKIMRDTLRSNYETQDYADLHNLEAGVLISAVDYALNSTVSGRVVTNGSNLIVREWNGKNEWGKPIDRLAPDTVVAVLSGPDGGLFHAVQLSDGRIGAVHKNYLLLETPEIDARARVYETVDGFTLGKKGLALIAKDGPGQADAELDALTALVGRDGTSAPVNLIAIRREIGQRAPWLAVVDFTDLSTVDQLGEGRPDTQGVNAQLPAKQSKPTKGLPNKGPR